MTTPTHLTDNSIFETAARFANAHIQSAEDSRVSMRELYEAFTNFLQVREMPASELPSMKSFATWAKAMFPTTKTNVIYLKGITLVAPEDLFTQYVQERLVVTTEEHNLPVSIVLDDFSSWFKEQGMVFPADNITLTRFHVHLSQQCSVVKTPRSCFSSLSFSC